MGKITDRLKAEAKLPQTLKEVEIFMGNKNNYEIDWMTRKMYSQWLKVAQSWCDLHIGKPITRAQFEDLCHITTEYFEGGITCKEYNSLNADQINSFNRALLGLNGPYWEDLAI